MVLAESGNERYHCWAISVRWKTILTRICCSVIECSAHHSTNKVHHCVAYIFQFYRNYRKLNTIFRSDVLVEFVVLVCGALGAFSDISEFEAVEVDVDGISAKLS